MSRKPRIHQYAALPFILRDGQAEVLLITSREKGRWVVPKGWPMKKLSPHKAAAREAYEEAGLLGTVSKRPIGSFTYNKRLKSSGKLELCAVDVFLLRVETELDDWPEKGQRQKRWMSPATAAGLVTEPGLKNAILKAALR